MILEKTPTGRFVWTGRVPISLASDGYPSKKEAIAALDDRLAAINQDIRSRPKADVAALIAAGKPLITLGKKTPLYTYHDVPTGDGNVVEETWPTD